MTRVLLTNDDGFSAAGLHASVSAMRSAGYDVVVVAPDGNRSAMGHRVTVREPIELTRLSAEPGLDVWSCSGTPADCVRMAFFEEAIGALDLVVSGINHGVNLGEDVFYSGTFAAAAEAAFLGLPAIAASQAGRHADPGFLSEHPEEFPHAEYLARAVDAMSALGPDSGVVVNVNFPAMAPHDEVRKSTLGSRDWTMSGIVSEPTPTGVVVPTPWARDPLPTPSPGTDFDNVVHGYTAVTALQVRCGLREDEAAWKRLVDAGFPLRLNLGAVS